jgi:riboflavin kinase/FMN adenylyltransferase
LRPARIVTLDDFPHEWRGSVLAIGNFDGVHRGHQAVLRTATAEAERLGTRSIMLTLEPHPRAFFSGRPLFRLTPPTLKAALAAALGLDGTLVLTFDRALAQMPAEAFVRDVLVERLDIRAAATATTSTSATHDVARPPSSPTRDAVEVFRSRSSTR